MITPVTVLAGLDSVVGGAYSQTTNQLFFVEFGGDIDRLDLATATHTIIGTGYGQLEDIALSKDGRHAYVTERGGTFLKVDLLSANRASASVVASGMNAPHQISLDEAHNQAYIVEFNAPGRLVRVDLTTGVIHTVVSGLASAVGLAITSALDFAYVTEQTGGRITRIRLSDGHRDTIASGLTAPFFLDFLDAGESMLLTTERDPANHVTQVNLSTSPAAVSTIANVPFRPSQALPSSPGEVLVCSDSVISKLELLPYSSAGPILLGIGYVPFDRIFGGFADTTGVAGYFYQVKDSPFGGSLPVMVNFPGAVTAGANFYRVEIDGIPQTAPYTDLLLNPVTHHFDGITTLPVGGSFFPVRTAGQIWFNPWLSGFSDTTPFTNALHTLSVRLFSAANLASEIGHGTDAGRHVQILIDNGYPVASIDAILHGGVPVPICGIVHVTGDDKFQFVITAKDPEKHLLSWSLSALWGDNKSAAIASESYVPVPSKEWLGVVGAVVPVVPWHATVAGDPTSIQCAHTFYLGVWDRVINGWSYLHYSDYHKSITLLP